MNKDNLEICCEYVRGHLSEYIDSELPENEADAIGVHLLSCPECRADLDHLVHTVVAISDANVTPPESLYKSVMKSVKRQIFMKRFVRAGSTVVAASLLFFILIYTKPFVFFDGLASNQMMEDAPQVALENQAAFDADGFDNNEKNACGSISDKDCVLPEELNAAVSNYSANNVYTKVIYTSIKTDELEGLRNSLPESSLLYSDADNIAFEYSGEADVSAIVPDIADSSEPVIVVVCVKS